MTCFGLSRRRRLVELDIQKWERKMASQRCEFVDYIATALACDSADLVADQAKKYIAQMDYYRDEVRELQSALRRLS